MPEDTRLIGGLCCQPTGVVGPLVATSVNNAQKLLKASRFEHWNTFQNEVSTIKSDIQVKIEDGGCHQNHAQDLCKGKFRKEDCNHDYCQEITKYKRKMRSQPQSHRVLVKRTEKLLSDGIRRLARMLRPNINVRVEKERALYATNGTAVIPDLAIRKSGENVPQAVIEAKTATEKRLCPSLHNHTLADALNHYRGTPLPGPTDEELGYQLLSLTQLIKYTMFTSTGYGCLFTHNEAVFIKVSPSSQTLPTGQIRLKHRVKVSRVYRCNGSTSVLEAILAMMVKADESSSNAYESLQNHFSQLCDASENGMDVIYSPPHMAH